MSLLEALAPFQPQPLGMSRCFDSSNLDLTAQVWDLGIWEHNKNKTPATGTALGSFPILNKWRVCPNSAPSQAKSFMALPVTLFSSWALRGSGVLCESSSQESARTHLQLTHQTPLGCPMSLPPFHIPVSSIWAAMGICPFCPSQCLWCLR